MEHGQLTVMIGYCVEKCPKKCLSIVPGYTEPSSEKTIQTVKVEVPPPPKPAAKPAAPKPAADKAPENKE